MTDALTPAADAPRALAGLSEIADGYDALLVDVWGVLHNGRETFAPAVDACRRFRAERGPVVLISNAPAPRRFVERVFEQIGETMDFYDGVATSGDAVRAELAARAPGPAFKLGPDWDDRLYDETGLAFADFESAAFISCTGLVEDERETPADYAELLAKARARDMEMVCANPDVVVQRGDRLIYCAGALAQAYQALGGKVVMAGKPYAPIYRLAYAAAEAASGRPVDKARTLAVGDGPDTDMLGATNQGLDGLFIAGGVASGEFEGEGFSPERARAVLLAKGRRAAYAMAALAW